MKLVEVDEHFETRSKTNALIPTPLDMDALEIEKRFAERLKVILEMRNIKPFTLAKALVVKGVISAKSDRVVYNWQAARDMPSFVTLCAICKELGVTTDYFSVKEHPLAMQHIEFLRQVKAGKQMLTEGRF